MSQPIVYQLGHDPIKDHCFAPGYELLAVTKENTVELYQTKPNSPSKPQLITVLKGHDKTVTSVDISPDGSKILTCSQDRNALVWEWNAQANDFKPTLVLLRINRAATVCKWSPKGDKFAVGSADRIIAVCYYEEENDWWVSKHLKKPLKSTITSLSWHPNNVLLASGSTDGHVRVFSAYIKGVDEKPEPSVWGSKLPFQTLVGDYVNDTGAWVHDVAFNNDGQGDSLAYVCHDGSVSVVYPAEDQPPVAFITVKSNHLPFKSLLYSGNRIIAGGHNCTLIVYEGSQNGWKEAFPLEKQKDLIHDVAPVDEEAEISSHDALNMFKQLDLKGRANRPNERGSGKALSTINQNTIASIRWYDHGKVSTSGIDGKIVIFTV